MNVEIKTSTKQTYNFASESGFGVSYIKITKSMFIELIQAARVYGTLTIDGQEINKGEEFADNTLSINTKE